MRYQACFENENTLRFFPQSLLSLCTFTALRSVWLKRLLRKLRNVIIRTIFLKKQYIGNLEENKSKTFGVMN